MFSMRFVSALLGCLWIASCGTQHAERSVVGFAAPAPRPLPKRPPKASSIVLVTLDGARWQDVFDASVMPNLHRFTTADGVAIGAPDHGEIWSTGPAYISMPGYTEILTGRTSACQTNECGQTTASTLVDEIDDSVVIASWERIARVATRHPERTIMSAGRTTGGRRDGLDESALREGAESSAWPGIDDYRPDALTARVALRLLDERTPKFLFVGLGDPDEHAHHGERDRYVQSLRDADRVLGEIEARLPRDAAIFVTADHGRAASFRDHGREFPESGRVWLAARGAGVASRGWVDTANHRLADVAPTIRCLLGMPRDHATTAGVAIREICDE